MSSAGDPWGVPRVRDSTCQRLACPDRRLTHLQEEAILHLVSSCASTWLLCPTSTNTPSPQALFSAPTAAPSSTHRGVC